MQVQGFRDTQADNVRSLAAGSGEAQNARSLFYAQQLQTAQQAQAVQDTLKDQAAQTESTTAATRQKAAAPRMPRGGVVGGAVGGMMKVANLPAGASLGLRVTVLRRQQTGEFAVADPANLSVGDTVKLQVLPNDDGLLSVSQIQAAGAPQNLRTAPVERMKPFEIPVPSPGQPGTREYLVMLVRQPGVQPASVAVNPVVDLGRLRSDQQSETDAREGATYSVNSKADATRVVQPVKLTYK
jgi:hypothetical protein